MMKESPRLRRRDNGNWYIHYSRKRRFSMGTRDKWAARELLNREIDELKAGRLIRTDKAKRIRLSELLREYVEGTETLPNRRLGCEPGTIKNDELAFKKFIACSGDIPIRQVNQKVIDDFKEFELTNTTGSKFYVNMLLRPLRAAFNASKDCGYIDENPFVKKRGRRPVLFETGKRIPRFLTEEEIGRMRGVLEERLANLRRELLAEPDAYKKRLIDDRIEKAGQFLRMLNFYLYTGLRRAELVRLTWRNINLAGNVIFIEKTKNHDEKSIAIHPELRKLIGEMGPRDIGPVFPRWRSYDTVSRLFKEVAVAAGVNKKLHGLRHAFGSWAAMSGINIRSIQRMMGHRDIKTTQIYLDVTDEQLQADILKLKFGRVE